MADVTKSKWLQGMKENVAKKKKAAMKQDLIRTGVMFIIGVLIIIVAKIAKSVVGVFGVLLVLLAILVEIILLLVRLPMSAKSLEKQMKKVLVTDQLVDQFDEELMGTPKAIVQITGGRVVFTEHFVMSQYETMGMNRFSRILLWEQMEEMDTTVYRTNGQINGIVTRFYKPGEKKACQAVEFKVAKDSEAFLAKLTELKPDIRVRQ